ncbi:MAG TPA: NAD(P)H-hydrate epimerase, partial [Syntrophorhabdaceae bacterium]|nr:NAD(P)H-hydrate epimerase [Syntrophorhabdaceae bacterium]
MKILIPERMAKYDRYAIETWGIPSAVLMENAGRNTYRLIKERYLSEKKRIAIICGRGNNGGDGYVAAALLKAAGLDVRVAACDAPRTDLARAARARWDGP